MNLIKLIDESVDNYANNNTLSNNLTLGEIKCLCLAYILNTTTSYHTAKDFILKMGPDDNLYIDSVSRGEFSNIYVPSQYNSAYTEQSMRILSEDDQERFQRIKEQFLKANDIFDMTPQSKEDLIFLIEHFKDKYKENPEKIMTILFNNIPQLYRQLTEEKFMLPEDTRYVINEIVKSDNFNEEKMNPLILYALLSDEHIMLKHSAEKAFENKTEDEIIKKINDISSLSDSYLHHIVNNEDKFDAIKSVINKANFKKTKEYYLSKIENILPDSIEILIQPYTDLVAHLKEVINQHYPLFSQGVTEVSHFSNELVEGIDRAKDSDEQSEYLEEIYNKIISNIGIEGDRSFNINVDIGKKNININDSTINIFLKEQQNSNLFLIGNDIESFAFLKTTQDKSIKSNIFLNFSKNDFVPITVFNKIIDRAAPLLDNKNIFFVIDDEKTRLDFKILLESKIKELGLSSEILVNRSDVIYIENIDESILSNRDIARDYGYRDLSSRNIEPKRVKEYIDRLEAVIEEKGRKNPNLYDFLHDEKLKIIGELEQPTQQNTLINKKKFKFS